MEKIALAVDSCCDLDLETLRHLNITLLPTKIIFDENEYIDKLTITTQELYERLNTQIPTTSLPNMQDSERAIRNLAELGYTDVIVVTIANALSGTYNALRLIAQDIENINVHVIDSKTVGYAEGVLTLEIFKLIHNKHTISYIMGEIPNIRKRIHGYMVPNTLTHLTKGGRLSKAAGTIGEILSIKPIISFDGEGNIFVHSKVRGRKKSIAHVIELAKEHLKLKYCDVWILNSDTTTEVETIYNALKDEEKLSSIQCVDIGPSIGVHLGNQSIGIVLLEADSRIWF